MVGWMIFGSILLLLIVLLSLSVTFRVQYDDDLTITVGAGKFRYTLVPVPDEEKADAKKGGKAAKKGIQKEQKKVNPKSEKKIEKGDIKETVFLVLDILKSIWPPFKDLVKRVRITALSIRVVAGGEDAAETALLYGKICAFVYGGLAALKNLMTVKVDQIDISGNFLQDHTEQTVFFKVKIRVLSVIWAGLRMAWGLLVNTFKRARENAAKGQKNSHTEPEGVPVKSGTAAGNDRRN